VRGLFSRFSFLYDFMVYMVVLGAGLARNYIVRYRARLDEARRLQAEAAELHAQLADARLNALRTQLKPAAPAVVAPKVRVVGRGPSADGDRASAGNGSGCQVAGGAPGRRGQGRRGPRRRPQAGC